jgi:hypothetical protein
MFGTAHPDERKRMTPDGPDGAPKRGGIGQQIFDQVQRMLNDEGVSATEAFRRISQETGRREGTVAANYYRIARMQGVTRSRGGGAGRPRGRRASGGTGDVQAAVKRVSAALDELTAAVRRQEQEIARLRQENGRLEEIRRLARRLSK